MHEVRTTHGESLVHHEKATNPYKAMMEQYSNLGKQVASDKH